MMGCKALWLPRFFHLKRGDAARTDDDQYDDDEKQININRNDLSSYILLYIDSL